MSSVIIFHGLLGLCVLFFMTPALDSTRQENSLESELGGEFIANRDSDIAKGNEVPYWPWGNKQTFKCPFLVGVFPDPSDCSYFYVCITGFSSRTRCPIGMRFDKYTRMCVSFLIATCATEEDQKKKDLDQTTSSQPEKITEFLTTTKQEETKAEECPKENGRFSKSGTNCKSYYDCVNGKPTEKRCPLDQLFDPSKSKCEWSELYTCVDTDGKECPKENGLFLKYGTNCRKYYDCKNGKPTEKQCPGDQMFNPSHGKCEWPELYTCNEIERSTVIVPKVTTERIETSTETTPTEVKTTHEHIETTSETPKTTSPEPDTTTTIVSTTEIFESTTEDVVIEEETTAERTESHEMPTTTSEPPMTSTPRVTAPETECDVNDLDCIISDLGVTPDWFNCPDGVGSYPHPVSNRLFIFCMNKKPRVKRCGQDFVFSLEYKTCVPPKGYAKEKHSCWY